MIRRLYLLAIASLTMVLLVMTAGSIVRMSGAGMGCPDWPKCFGYYIPPTDVETLTWREGKSFKKGQMILHEERFLVAQFDLTSGERFNPENWEVYTRHDYTHFDPLHTWIEYINRLIGALTGIPVLLFFLLSIAYVRKDALVTLLGFLGVFFLGFSAWLGKLVVDGNLVPHSITYHMFSALALVAIYAYLIGRLQVYTLSFRSKRDSNITRLAWVCMALLLLQIFLGTFVREEVDIIARQGSLERSMWIESLSWIFKVHRSFSILVLGGIGLLAYWIIRMRGVSAWPRILLALVILEILAGMALAYLNMPAIVQPIHLIFAAFTFAVLVYVTVQYYRKTSSDVTS